MADKFDVNIKGVKEINAELRKREKMFAIGSPLYSDIGAIAVRGIKKIFQQEGPGWQKSGRARKGIKIKSGKRKGEKKTGKTLQDTGRLRKSITFRVKGKRVIVGTNVKYAAIHNFGGTIKHPGESPFIMTDDGIIFMKKDGKYPEGTRFTKKHDIKMPKREYMIINLSTARAMKRRLKKGVDKGK